MLNIPHPFSVIVLWQCTVVLRVAGLVLLTVHILLMIQCLAFYSRFGRQNLNLSLG